MNAINDWNQIVLNRYPEEAVAVVVDDEIIELQNISPEPTEHFKIKPQEWVKYSDKAQYLLHSHTYDINDNTIDIDPRTPSSADMAAQKDMGIPWGIVSTEGTEVSDILWLGAEERPPLLGRQFIHGVTDCYSIIRDFYKIEFNVDLPDYPREFDWWNDGEGYTQNLYEKYYEDAGFYDITRDELQYGDVIMYSVLSRKGISNHAGVYVGDNQVLHHLLGQLSQRVSMDKWQKRETRYVRYKW